MHNKYLFVSDDLTRYAEFESEKLALLSERHRVHFSPLTFSSTEDIAQEWKKVQPAGVIFSLQRGLPSFEQLKIIRNVLRFGINAYVYWPMEMSLECINYEHYRSLYRYKVFAGVFFTLKKALAEYRVMRTTARCSHKIASTSITLKPNMWGCNNAGIIAQQCAGENVRVTGDDTQFGYQCAIRQIVVKRNCFYSFHVPVNQIQGHVGIGIEGSDCQWLVFCTPSDEPITFYTGSSNEVSVVITNNSQSVKTECTIFEVGAGWLKEAQLISRHAALSRIIYRYGTRFLKFSLQRGSNDAGLSLSLRARCLNDLCTLINAASPVPLKDTTPPIPGRGAYLRLDFWGKISSGGSYGHTCFVAKELAKSTHSFTCYMGHRYSLIDEMGIEQVALPAPGENQDEETLVRATEAYYPALQKMFAKNPPAYIYERICLGNYVGCRLSQEFSCPYIVEYNGSEISMKLSFDGSRYEFEDVYLAAEEAAFRQATLISVVSEVVKDSLVQRGVDANKIIVNPNGVDLDTYHPVEDVARRDLRRELGFEDTHIVVCFTGTFGGWHGIEVLAQAMPSILKENSNIRFLFIGDGNFKHLIDESIARNRLRERVVSVGRVPQKEGARLLGACDIFVSPHSCHMVDSKFFGSPTKIFEYMAMGQGIVGSDLEQIGQVLSPCLRATNLSDEEVSVHDERSVLCKPGDVQEFIAAVLYLAKYPDLRKALGRNAFTAAKEFFSWERHIQRLWRFGAGDYTVSFSSSTPDLNTGDSCVEFVQIMDDSFKKEAQKQWDNDPCGSHYVKEEEHYSLQWYLEAEQYRYGVYAPWMAEVMEFNQHSGERVLELGGGMGTDLVQFARHGAIVTDFDLSQGHLAAAKENFRQRGLQASFEYGDAESLPFEEGSFDLVYTNGVIHHIPNTATVVAEIFRILKPGGKVIAMVYAENSLHFWRRLVYDEGVKKDNLLFASMGEIMSREVEISVHGNATPLVKVYTKQNLRSMFKKKGFVDIQILQRQLIKEELHSWMRWIPLSIAGKLLGWNLIIKAVKPVKAVF